ncbi:MAG TPA: chemotaxis protein CheD [Cyclobacteriaceae bacterium]|jgi:chemotaxis protein CheD|nr:chemotaxis protein CheD [Cyclobacteriaceae bacterium]
MELIDSIQGKHEYSISPGEVKSFSTPVTISCFGLGSCVGVFLQDQKKGIAGGAHINLSDDFNDLGPNGKPDNVKQAIRELLEQLKERGSDLKALRAKVAGGASSPASPSSFAGNKNIESVINYLIEEKVFLAAMDVGGTQNRIAKFDGVSGMLLIRHSDSNYYKVF